MKNKFTKFLRGLLAFLMLFFVFTGMNLNVHAEEPALVSDPKPLTPGGAKVTAMYIASTIDGTDYTTGDAPD